MRRTMRCIPAAAVILSLCLVVSGCGKGTDRWQELYRETGDRLAATTPTVGSVGGEWVVIGLARSGRLTEQAAAAYLAAAEDYVRSVGRDRLHPVKSTDNARLILGITAAGGDPSAVGGYNLLRGLADLSYIREQGSNGPVWALIAFDCGRYVIPGEGGLTREALVEEILSRQCADGGWGFLGDVSDVDMTAMALQALAPYREQERVSAAAERALDVLAAKQMADGGYASYGTQNCESCAQVMVALCTWQVDPQQDECFIRNGHSVLENLCGFAAEGGFCHQKDKPQADAMATEQAYYALTAYDRYRNGMSSLYAMR